MCSLFFFESVSLTYRTRGVLILDLEEVHGSDHGLHGHEDVLVHQLDVRPLLLVRKACSMDDLHLLDERRLARLASACAKQFYSKYHILEEGLGQHGTFVL